MSHEGALSALNTLRLSERRYNLCLSFAKKAYRNPKYTNWFNPHPFVNTANTRSEKHELSFKPVDFRTNRFRDSPLPYLTEILNVDKMKKNNRS